MWGPKLSVKTYFNFNISYLFIQLVLESLTRAGGE